VWTTFEKSLVLTSCSKLFGLLMRWRMQPSVKRAKWKAKNIVYSEHLNKQNSNEMSNGQIFFEQK